MSFLPIESSVPGLKMAGEKSKCVQSLAKSCDIKAIIARCTGGDLSSLRNRPSGDFRNISDNPHEMMLQFVDAKNKFDSLPQEVHDAYPTVDHLLAALENPAEHDRLVSLGIYKPKKDAKIVDVPAVRPPESNPAPVQ